ncbi:MAG TPA: hypothetical protein VL981_14605, partial [Candidatus Methylacidiphilales bacterium]|nr:hypothetical protein [Candidatus Methylacidiphilales bacterium]
PPWPHGEMNADPILYERAAIFISGIILQIIGFLIVIFAKMKWAGWAGFIILILAGCYLMRFSILCGYNN